MKARKDTLFKACLILNFGLESCVDDDSTCDGGHEGDATFVQDRN